MGSNEIGKAYFGSNLVFDSGSGPQPIVPDHACITFTSSGTNGLSMTIAGTASPTLYYSTDGTTWTQWDYSEISFSKNHPLFMYGSNSSSFSTSTSNYAQFAMTGTGEVTCSGNIMTLVNGAETSTTIPGNGYYFCRLFRACTQLVSGPTLPATTLKQYCYHLMYYGCTGLTSAPVRPSTTLANHCYNQMFRGCTHLTTAPDLLATTLPTRAYYYMFYGCTRLNYVKALFTTTPGSNYTSNWLYNVASSGTFVKNSSATWTTTGANGVPSGWTIQYASS